MSSSEWHFKFANVNETFSSRMVLCLSSFKLGPILFEQFCLCLSPKKRLYSSNFKDYFCYSGVYVSCAWNWTLNDCFGFCIGQILPLTITNLFRSIPFWHVIPRWFYFIYWCFFYCFFFVAKLSSRRAKREKGKSCFDQWCLKLLCP